MPRIIAVLFEEQIQNSYIAIRLEGDEPEILFTKGPGFTKIMGPYPVAYAEATFKRWKYCPVENPPEIMLHDKKSILDALVCICRANENSARYCAGKK